MKTANVIIPVVEIYLADGQILGDYQVTLICTTPETAFAQQIQRAPIATGISFPDLQPGSYEISVVRLDVNNFQVGEMHSIAFEVPVQLKGEVPAGISVVLT